MELKKLANKSNNLADFKQVCEDSLFLQRVSKITRSKIDLYQLAKLVRVKLICIS